LWKNIILVVQQAQILKIQRLMSYLQSESESDTFKEINRRQAYGFLASR